MMLRVPLLSTPRRSYQEAAQQGVEPDGRPRTAARGLSPRRT